MHHRECKRKTPSPTASNDSRHKISLAWDSGRRSPYFFRLQSSRGRHEGYGREVMGLARMGCVCVVSQNQMQRQVSAMQVLALALLGEAMTV
jgi:hypothetical protein